MSDVLPGSLAAYLDRVCDAFERDATREPHPLTRDAYRNAAWTFSGGSTARAHLVAAFGTLGYVTSPDADPYPDDAAMRRAASDARRGRYPFLVSRAHCGHAVWSELDNVAFRAWHDATHVVYDLPAFDVAGETALAYVAGVACAAPFGRMSGFVRVMLAEIVGQAAYHRRHGRFPTLADGTQPVPRDIFDDEWTDIARELGVVADVAARFVRLRRSLDVVAGVESLSMDDPTDRARLAALLAGAS